MYGAKEKNRITKKMLAEFAVLLVINIVCLFFVEDRIENAKVIGLITLILFAIATFRVRRNKCLVTMFGIMFYILLSAMVLAVFHYEDQAGFLYRSNMNVIHTKCYLIFASVMFASTRFIVGKTICSTEDEVDLEANNPWIVFFCLIILTAIFATSFDYSLRGTYSSSALYEYSIFFFAKAWIYGKGNKLSRGAWLVFAAYYIVVGIVSGDRSSFFILAVMLALLTSKRIKLSGLIAGSLGAVIFANMLDTFRHKGILSVTLGDMVNNAFAGGLKRMLASTARSSYAAGNTIINLSFEYVGSKSALLFSRILNIFLPDSLVESASLTKMARAYYVNYGGGMYTSYFYFYGGYIGVFLATVLLCFILWYVYTNKRSKFCHLLTYVLPAMALRWFLYSPMALFSACLFRFWVIFVFFMFIDQITRKRHEL